MPAVEETNEDNVRSSTRTVRTALEALKNDYSGLQNKISNAMVNNQNPAMKDLAEHKLGIIDKSLEKVTLGIEETDILLALAEYLQHLEVDKMRVRMQVKRLYQENEWLREELENLQRRLCKLDQDLTTAEAEKQHFQFLYEMRKHDSNQEQPTDSLSKSKEKESEEDDAGDDVPPRLRTLHNLVVQYANQGRYEVAIPLCKQALNDLRKSNGDKHPDVATMLSMLALVYRDQSNFKEATTLLEEALKIREQAYGKEHSTVAATLNNLAVLLVKRGKYKEAEPLCRRALAIREKVLGKSHPDVAKQLNNLALLCQNLQRYDDVENLYLEAIRVYSSKPEANDANIIKTKNNLVSLYVKQQKFADAERVLKEVIDESHERNFSKPSDINPSVWMIVENKAKADPKRIRETVDHLMSKFGRLTDPVMIVTIKNLASLYKKRNKADAAAFLDEWIETSMKQAAAPPPPKRPEPAPKPIETSDSKDNKKEKKEKKAKEKADKAAAKAEKNDKDDKKAKAPPPVKVSNEPKESASAQSSQADAGKNSSVSSSKSDPKKKGKFFSGMFGKKGKK